MSKKDENTVPAPELLDTPPELSENSIPVKSMPPVKFKDRNVNRRGMKFNILETFGFIPEYLIIEKVYGESNTIVVHAVLTETEVKKEEKARGKMKSKLGKTIKDAQNRLQRKN